MGMYERMLSAHQAVYERSGGRFGHRLLLGLPSLLLRTTGRKSGLRRTSGLIYVRDGDDFLVVASNNGDPAPPNWLANVKAHPDCEIQIDRTVLTARATAIYPDDPSYARRWTLVNRPLFGLHEKRQQAMTRRIAIVVLSPNSPGGACTVARDPSDHTPLANHPRGAAARQVTLSGRSSARTGSRPISSSGICPITSH